MRNTYLQYYKVNKNIVFLSFLFFVIAGCSVKAQDGVTKVYPSKFVELKNNHADLQIVDVRTPEEYKEGHIKESVNIDYRNDFEKHIATLDKDKPVIVYCKSGWRSSRSADILLEKGFKVVFDLSGGIEEWKNLDYPVEK